MQDYSNEQNMNNSNNGRKFDENNNNQPEPNTSGKPHGHPTHPTESIRPFLVISASCRASLFLIKDPRERDLIVIVTT
jgi:hypothetical protein